MDEMTQSTQTRNGLEQVLDDKPEGSVSIASGREYGEIDIDIASHRVEGAKPHREKS